jgi:hypothetical protein
MATPTVRWLTFVKVLVWSEGEGWRREDLFYIYESTLYTPLETENANKYLQIM